MTTNQRAEAAYPYFARKPREARHILEHKNNTKSFWAEPPPKFLGEKEARKPDRCQGSKSKKTDIVPK